MTLCSRARLEVCLWPFRWPVVHERHDPRRDMRVASDACTSVTALTNNELAYVAHEGEMYNIGSTGGHTRHGVVTVDSWHRNTERSEEGRERWLTKWIIFKVRGDGYNSLGLHLFSEAIHSFTKVATTHLHGSGPARGSSWKLPYLQWIENVKKKHEKNHHGLSGIL